MPEWNVPPRAAIAPEHTWNAPSVFASEEAWEAEMQDIIGALPTLSRWQGHLADGPDVLVVALTARDELRRRAQVAQVYAGMEYAVETTNQAASARSSRAAAVYSRVLAAGAFIEPELLALGQETLAQWLQIEPRLAAYRHYVTDLWRKQAHVRSSEVEELLGMLTEPFAGAEGAASMLTNADFRFRPARASDGAEIPVTQGTFTALMDHPDRETRRTAWESYRQQYLAHKNTLASTLATSIKQNVFAMRARRHDSTLAASLFENNIPPVVFHNLIDTFQRNLPTWHRYWAVRKKALGVETLHPYDVWAPLASNPPVIPFVQAVEWISAGLAPMGDDYVRIVRAGCLQDRWIDLYPNQGKSQGAFSWGAQGTHPFIMMSYTDDMRSLSTLAHELGHSLHSYLTWQQQPTIYSDYSLFVAEVASNFHQAMVRAHLLATRSDRDFQISVIEEAMSNFYRYFLVMPTLARFELEMHDRVEQGKGLTADFMIERMADLFAEAFGPDMHIDRESVGITWATFNHLYADYYVYQYATGITGAHACARRILDGAPGAAADYLRFLSAGGSLHPLEALALAGVDLRQPQPVEAAFDVLANYVDRIEALTASTPHPQT